jgi:hypothetical protein
LGMDHNRIARVGIERLADAPAIAGAPKN